jgi:lysophospholipase L1-like esterase
MNWETLVCFGDSITFGARSYLGYPELCGHLLSNKLDKRWNVINHATNGFTTIDLVRSVNSVFSEIKNTYPSIITVMIGTNDIKNGTALADFKIAYNQLMIKLGLLAVNRNVLVLKIPPLTQKVFYPYTFAMNEQINVFNQLIEEIAVHYNFRSFDLSFVEEDFFDGVHLSKLGVESVSRQLAEFILKDKGF